MGIPYTRLRSRLDEVPCGCKLFIHRESGKRASLAALYLQAEGNDVVHVDGICAECERIARAEVVAH
jgi:hypothetical protein